VSLKLSTVFSIKDKKKYRFVVTHFVYFMDPKAPPFDWYQIHNLLDNAHASLSSMEQSIQPLERPSDVLEYDPEYPQMYCVADQRELGSKTSVVCATNVPLHITETLLFELVTFWLNLEKIRAYVVRVRFTNYRTGWIHFSTLEAAERCVCRLQRLLWCGETLHFSLLQGY
jgi:hypothetical protein